MLRQIKRSLHGAVAGCLVTAAASAAVLGDLRCEKMVNPLGIDEMQPRLSWTFGGGGGSQRAYQVLVASSPEKLQANDGDLWDSGRVVSSQTSQIRYDGKALASRQRCYWKIRAWDAFYQPTVYSAAATWETGLLASADWKAKWIGTGQTDGAGAQYFRYELSVPKPIREARAYVATAGGHEFRVNGRLAGQEIAKTQTDGRIGYLTCDIGPMLRQGENVLEVIAAKPKLLLQVELSYADGTRDEIYTDAGAVRGRAWVAAPGPILSVAGGEVYDARHEELSADAWETVVRVQPPPGRLAAQFAPAGRLESLRPDKMTEPKPGVVVFDMGRTVIGCPELHINGERGRAVTLRLGESLDAGGWIDQVDPAGVYILKGAGQEQWAPHFFSGKFRYVELEGLPGPPEPGNLLVHAIRGEAETKRRPR